MSKKKNKKSKNNVSNVSKASKTKAKGKTVETSEMSEALNLTIAAAATIPAPPKPPTAAEIKKAEQEKIISFLDDLSLYLELFHDADDTAYVTYSKSENFDSNFRTCKIESLEYKNFLRHQTWTRLGLSIPNPMLNQRVSDYATRALFNDDAPERPVFLRVGEHGDDIFIDLCNDKGQAVKVTADGWTVVDDPDCKFRRASGMRPLPTPVSGGSIAELDRFLNLSPNDRILFLSVLLAAFQFNKPTPILLITGEHGSGKTTLSKIFRSLIDPSKAPAQTASNDERDLLIACNNSWVVNIDNQSKLPDKMSDNLCRLATGSSLRTRKLRTDAEEQIFSAIRPVLLNSIEELATRPDFLDRSVHIHTRNINQRVGENSLWILFQGKAPRIFGALLDAVATALKRRPIIVEKIIPRMADFTKWACAGAPALGFTQEQFLNAYEANRTAGSREALDASPIYLPLMMLLDNVAGHTSSGGISAQTRVGAYQSAVITKGLFRGSAKDLLMVLKANDAGERPHDFPKTPKMLAAMLARLIPNLRAEGIEVNYLDRDPMRRVRILEIKASNVSNASETQPLSGRAKTPRLQSIAS